MMTSKILKYIDSIVYIILGLLALVLLNKEFIGKTSKFLLYIVGFIGISYFIINKIRDIKYKLYHDIKVYYISVITFFVVIFSVWMLTDLHTNEKFKSKRILKAYSLSGIRSREIMILRENNDFDMNRDASRGYLFKSGKYKLSGDTIILLDESLNYYDNQKKQYYYFNKYLLDSTKGLIIPINKENKIMRDSKFMFKFKP